MKKNLKDKKLAIIGSGDLGQLIAYHASIDSGMQIAGFFNDFLETGENVNGIPVLGGLDDVSYLYNKGLFDCLMIGIGYKHFSFRKGSFDRFKDEIPFANIIHSTCFVDESCILGEGIFMLPGSTLDFNVCIGDNVLLNTSCTIAHDSSVGNHSFLSPRVAMAGFIEVGECCNLGINCTIIDNITIVDNCQLGGGAVVINNINKPGLYVGSPARFIR